MNNLPINCIYSCIHSCSDAYCLRKTPLHVTVHDCCHAFESFLGVFVQRIKGPLRQFIRTDYQRHSNDLLVYLTFHIIGTQRILFCELASLKSGKICQTDITSNKTSQSYSDTWLV